MKKVSLVVLLSGVFGLLVGGASSLYAKGGPPEDVGAMVLERILEAFQQVALVAPSWLADFFDAMILFLQGLLGA